MAAAWQKRSTWHTKLTTGKGGYTYVGCTWWCAVSAPQLSTFEPFSRANAMRCTCRSDISSSCLPTPTLYALPGVASAVPASCPGEACCLFRFMQIFVPIPSVYSYVKIHFSLNACKQGIGWLRRLFYLPLQSTGRRFKSWRGLVTVSYTHLTLPTIYSV